MSLYVTTCDRNAARPVQDCSGSGGRQGADWVLRTLTHAARPRSPAHHHHFTTPYPRHIFSSYPRSDRYPPPTTSFPTPLYDLPLVSRMFRVMTSTYRRLFYLSTTQLNGTSLLLLCSDVRLPRLPPSYRGAGEYYITPIPTCTNLLCTYVSEGIRISKHQNTKHKEIQNAGESRAKLGMESTQCKSTTLHGSILFLVSGEEPKSWCQWWVFVSGLRAALREYLW